MQKIFPLVILAIAAASPAAGQSVTGQWNATMDTPGAQVAFQILFQVKGDSLFGTVKRSSGDVALTGRLKGDSLSFQYTVLYNENPFTMVLRGKVKGDSLTGVVDFGGGNEGAFAAKRVGSSADSLKKGGGGF